MEERVENIYTDGYNWLVEGEHMAEKQSNLSGENPQDAEADIEKSGETE